MLRSTGADTSASSTPVDETSQPLELLLSVDRDGAGHARRADRGPAAARDPRRRAAARRAGAVDARPRAPARRLAPGRRRRLRAARGRGLPEPAPGRAAARVRRRGGRARARPRRRRPTAAGAASPPRFDFRPSVPDVSTFPRAAWLRCAARGARDDHRRRARLRRPVRRRGAARRARRLPRPRPRRRRRPRAGRGHQRLRAGPGRSSATRSRRAARKRIALEDPSNPEQHEIAARAGLEPVPVAGRRGRAAASTRSRAPTSTRWSSRPRTSTRPASCSAASAATALLAWLREHDAIAIEDDYDAEYRYDRAAVGALQGLEPDRVVYAGSTSKTLAPALRLGWLVVPPRLLDARPRREAARRPGHGADRAARVRRLPRARRARPPPAPHARPLPRAPRRARRGARRAELPEATVRGDRRRAARRPSSCRRRRRAGDREAAARERRIALSTMGDYAHARPARRR